MNTFFHETFNASQFTNVCGRCRWRKVNRQNQIKHTTRSNRRKKINFTPSWHWLIVMRFKILKASVCAHFFSLALLNAFPFVIVDVVENCHKYSIQVAYEILWISHPEIDRLLMSRAIAHTHKTWKSASSTVHILKYRAKGELLKASIIIEKYFACLPRMHYACSVHVQCECKTRDATMHKVFIRLLYLWCEQTRMHRLRPLRHRESEIQTEESTNYTEEC